MSDQVFGPYRLMSLLGRGGMGEVWRAIDTSHNDRVVAVKVLSAALGADEDFRRRFRRESALAAKLSDPHIVPIHRYGEIDGRLFIDMPLIIGSDLHELITDRGALTAQRAVMLVEQVAGALDTAHRAGLIHRDVKPSNILIGGDEADFAYLIDFGICRPISGATITLTGAVLGTPAYMAPERFDGHGDHRSDIYALTCVLYEALTGQPPFNALSSWAFVKAHNDRPPPRPSAHDPALPSGLDAVIARGMAKNPNDRFGSARAMAAAARAALDAPSESAKARSAPTIIDRPKPALGGVETIPPTADQAPGRARRPRWLIATVILLVLATGGLLLVAVNSGFRSDSAAAPMRLAKAQSATEAGGMDALVAAAQAEGQLNTIALPADWANYGTIITSFTKKYGIRVNNLNPDASSQDQIAAIAQPGPSGGPDVLDLSRPIAAQAAKDGLLTPYRVVRFGEIPTRAAEPEGRWVDDYGGFMAIGYDPAAVPDPPTSFAELLEPQYRNQIGINGDPTVAGGAFSAIYAAALANGGSYDDIGPGIDYFKKLKDVGNLVPLTASAATAINGRTPILIMWEYLQLVQVRLPGWQVVIPSDGQFADYYTQAISTTAPHPAAARLWEEYLYSTEGQNLLLAGSVRPILLNNLVQDGTVDQQAFAKLPPPPTIVPAYPSESQLARAKAIVATQWATVVAN